MMDREHIVYQILDKDNWAVIDQIDEYLWIYDRKMSFRERIISNMKIKKYTTKEIATEMNISESTVRVHVHNLKKKILNELY